MVGTTLYSIMVLEDLFIVLFILIYIRQYRSTRQVLLLFGLSRFLHGVLFAFYATGLDNPVLLLIGRAALSFGLALESYCLIAVARGFDMRKACFLLGLAGLRLVVDLAAISSPPIQTGIGNFTGGVMLLFAWWHLAIGSDRSLIQKGTGWLIFGRGVYIMLSGLILDILFVEHREQLLVYFSSVVAAVSIFSPLLFLFLLKEWDERELEKTRQQILEQNKQLQELLATKNKFFSIIAHDLRNPMGAVLSLADMLTEDARKKEFGKTEEFGQLIREACQSSIVLLNNLLEWSRLQTGRIEYKPESVLVKPLFERVFKLSETMLNEKCIRFDFSADPELSLEGDPSMLETILRNLISNAAKFTHPGGRIMVSAEQDNEAVCIRVEDSGIGIAEDRLPLLFKVDQNTSTPGTEQEEGTGLGLPLCLEFMHLHGGDLSVSSVENKGSTFSMVFPKKSHDAKACP